MILIGARFICKLSENEKALMEVAHLYDHAPKNRHMVCCRVVKGTLIDDQGKPFGPGCVTDLPLDRVAAAIQRYQQKLGPADLPG